MDAPLFLREFVARPPPFYTRVSRLNVKVEYKKVVAGDILTCVMTRVSKHGVLAVEDKQHFTHKYARQKPYKPQKTSQYVKTNKNHSDVAMAIGKKRVRY